MTTGEEPGRWPELHRERRALVVVDVVESVRLMQEHEDEFIDRWRRFVAETRDELLPVHEGHLVKSLGDGMLLEFAQVPQAAAAALQMLARLELANAGLPDDRCINLRAGGHIADVVRTEWDVLGAGANLAARLAGLAAPGELVVSSEFRDLLAEGMDGQLRDLGECYLKHLPEPVRAFSVHRPQSAPAAWAAPQAPAFRSSQPRVVVVPLRTHGAEPETLALGDAVADELIAAFSRSPNLCVLSRHSTSALRRGSTQSVSEMAARHLDGDYLVSGSVREQHGRMRVHLEMADTRSHEVLWSDVLSAEVEAFFEGTDDMATTAVAAMARAVGDQQVRRVNALPIANLNGYTLYLGGVSLLHRLARNDFLRAHAVLQHLAEREPRSASPLAMLAKWHVFRMVQGWSEARQADGQAARDAARRAVDLAPDDALSLAMHGLTRSTVEGDIAAAGEILQRAVAANANEPYAWSFLAGNLTYRDQPLAGIEAARTALRLSPADPAKFLFESYLAQAQLAAGQWAQGVETARRSLALNALHSPSHRQLIIGLVMSGHVGLAREAALRHEQLEPLFSVSRYRDLYPGRNAEHLQTFADALTTAGLKN